MNQYDQLHYRFPRTTRQAYGSFIPMRRSFSFHHVCRTGWCGVIVMTIILAAFALA